MTEKINEKWKYNAKKMTSVSPLSPCMSSCPALVGIPSTVPL